MTNKQNKLLKQNLDIFILNKHGVRNNGQIKIYGYKTECKNISNKAREGAAITMIRNINHRIINNLSKNTVACKIQIRIAPILIATIYIPLWRLIISRADFDMLKIYNCLVYVLGDFNVNQRQLEDRQTNDSGEQLAELIQHITKVKNGEHKKWSKSTKPTDWRNGLQ